jgi:nucleotide-binding universal stress UspA family protein
MSDYSRMIIEYALEFVRGLNTEILLFNVINEIDIDAVNTLSPHFPGGFNVESYIERIKAERQRWIEEILERHFKEEKLQMKILIHVGIPFDAIIKAIETEKVDLVVIASKGKSNLIGTLHGSNAEKVFRHSPVPVLSVRSREKFGQHR